MDDVDCRVLCRDVTFDAGHEGRGGGRGLRQRVCGDKEESMGTAFICLSDIVHAVLRRVRESGDAQHRAFSECELAAFMGTLLKEHDYENRLARSV